MSLERLIDQTRERFPHYHESKVEILPLEKGGSDRYYYRVRLSADHSLILVKYNPEKPENERFVAIANFLTRERREVEHWITAGRDHGQLKAPPPSNVESE